MRNIQLTSEDTDCKVLVVGLLAGFFFVAGFIGWMFLQTPFDNLISIGLPPMNGVISVIVALFAWSSFRLIEPVRHSRRWLTAEYIVVPLLWLLLMVTIDVWLHDQVFLWTQAYYDVEF